MDCVLTGIFSVHLVRQLSIHLRRNHMDVHLLYARPIHEGIAGAGHVS